MLINKSVVICNQYAGIPFIRYTKNQFKILRAMKPKGLSRIANID